MKHQGLDHLAIVVPDTEVALKTWRDALGFPLLYSEVVNGGTVRLTHLDLGNTHLQLVEPLTPDQIDMILSADGQRLTLPELRKLPLITFDPLLRRLLQAEGAR